MRHLRPIAICVLLAGTALAQAADKEAQDAAQFAARILHTQCISKHADPGQVGAHNEFGLTRLPVDKSLHYLQWKAGSAWASKQPSGDFVLAISERRCSVMTRKVEMTAAKKHFLNVLHSVAGKAGSVTLLRHEQKRVKYGMVYRESYKVTTGLPDVIYGGELTLSDSPTAPLQSTISIEECDRELLLRAHCGQ
ncbi:MAG: hypothetical protein V4805_05905 [Pseudomonadota bacterium]